MNDALSHLTSNLRRARWRIAIANAADAAFVAVFVAGLTAAALSGFAITPRWPATVVGLAGFTAIWRRPPRLSAVADTLDGHHKLSNLLGSAWTTRDAPPGPWRTTIHTLAADRAAALPPLRDIARFSPRQRACGLAAVAAVWLSTGLLPSRVALGPDSRTLAAAAAARAEAEVVQVAAVVRRRPDTADGAASRSIEQTGTNGAAGGRSSKPATGDAAANGPGRADVRRTLTALPVDAAASSAAGAARGDGGSGRAGRATDAGFVADGAVVGGPAVNAARAKLIGVGGGAGGTGRTTAAGVPDAYRDLVRDFFAR